MPRDLLGSAMRVVEFLSRSREPVGVRELSRHLGVAAASAHRVLQSLKREGLVVQFGEQGMYSTGQRLVELSTNLMQTNHLVPIASPFLINAATQSGESAVLMVIDGHETLCVASVESEQLLRVVFPLGWRGPLYHGASGSILLAFQGPEFLEQVVAAGRRKSAGLTQQEAYALLRDLPQVRKTGVAVSYGERLEGWTSVAAAVYAPGGNVIGSVALYGPSARFLEDKLGKNFKQAVSCADAITVALGRKMNADGIGPRSATDPLVCRQHRISNTIANTLAKTTPSRLQ